MGETAATGLVSRTGPKIGDHARGESHRLLLLVGSNLPPSANRCRDGAPMPPATTTPRRLRRLLMSAPNSSTYSRGSLGPVMIRKGAINNNAAGAAESGEAKEGSAAILDDDIQLWTAM